MRIMALGLIAAGFVLGAGGCAVPYKRLAEPRERATIFTRIDLPAPNSMRTAAGEPGPDYWQQQVDYEIEATLDEAARRISASARVTYTNNSPDRLTFLWLQLEQNLFRAGSEGNLARADAVRFDFTTSEAYGYELHSVTSGGQALTLHVYDTLARLELPQAIQPGGAFSFEIAWSFVVPENGADRMGYEELEQGTVFQIAQWFPCVGVYDDVYGWNTLPYLGEGEFYTNFGRFDVRLTVPREHVVAATGLLQNPHEVLTAEQQERLRQAGESRETVFIVRPEEVGTAGSRPAGDGPLTWHFVANDVRTFAWASSRAFVWDAASIERRGRLPSEQSGQVTGLPERVLVQSFYPAEARPLWEQATQMGCESIEGYSRRWFEYPYPSAVNVNGRVSGMEYPMIVFCAERHDEYGLFDVTTHEFAHSWFPMIVNTDERRHGWMDEGFNSFINIYSIRERYLARDPAADELRGLAERMSRVHQPIDIWPDQVAQGGLGFLLYGKPAAGLFTLREGVLGPQRFDAAFRHYIRAWAFKSPRPADFYRCMENAAGMDLSWFWRGWIQETGQYDLSIRRVARGENGTVRVTLENRGELVMPVVLRARYGDGSEEVRRLPVQMWHNAREWTTEWDLAGRELREVKLDPLGVFPDVERGNDLWRGKVLGRRIKESRD